jgi:hypothetical protein
MVGERRPLRARGVPRCVQRADRAFEVPTKRGMEGPIHELHVSTHMATSKNQVTNHAIDRAPRSNRRNRRVL